MGVGVRPAGRVTGRSPSAIGRRRAVFLDRDGVINRFFVDEGVTKPPTHRGEFEILPGVREACERLIDGGFCLVVVTNQPDVARGRMSRSALDEIHEEVCRQLPIEAIRVCMHDDQDECACRKPRPGMLIESAGELGIDLSMSYMVGDRWSDVVCGESAGCTSILVATPYSKADRCSPAFTARDLKEATDWILRREAGENA